MEVDPALANQGTDDRERLLEPGDAVVEGEAERGVLALVPSGAEAEHEAPAGDPVDGRGHLGQHRRRVEARRRDERSELHARGHGSDRRQRRPHLPRPARHAAAAGRRADGRRARVESRPTSSAVRAIVSSSGHSTRRSTSGSWTPTRSGRLISRALLVGVVPRSFRRAPSNRPLTVTREPRNDERSWGPGCSLATRVSRMPRRRPGSCRTATGSGTDQCAHACRPISSWARSHTVMSRSPSRRVRSSARGLTRGRASPRRCAAALAIGLTSVPGWVPAEAAATVLARRQSAAARCDRAVLAVQTNTTRGAATVDRRTREARRRGASRSR